MSEKLLLADRHRVMVEALLAGHVTEVEVWAYGSRVNGRSHGGSDLDLVIRTHDLTPLDTSKLAAVDEAFRESNLPFLVDTHDWARLPKGFQDEIEKSHVVLIVGIKKGEAT